MEVLYVGGCGVGKTMAEVALKRQWSNGIILSGNTKVGITESKFSVTILNLNLRGLCLPRKLPSGYKTEK